LPRAFYWRVKEDDLVLYPNFMYDRLQGHAPFQELRSNERRIQVSSDKRALYLLSALLVSSALT
jgi:hypothetical protein